MNGSVMFAAGEDKLNWIRITEINVNSYHEYAYFTFLWDKRSTKSDTILYAHDKTVDLITKESWYKMITFNSCVDQMNK